MPRRRGGTSNELTADINVTSLVDVAFTLLVIFIITAPIMQAGVEVNIPKARAETITPAEAVIVTVNREGHVFIGEAQASEQEFESALTDVVREKQATSVYLRADESVPYGQVLRVLGTIKAMDIATVGLVAEPERPGRRSG